MDSPELWRKAEAIEAAGTNASEAIHEALVAVDDPVTAHNLLIHVQRLPGDKSRYLPAVREMAGRDWRVKKDVITTLGVIGTRDDVPLLLKCLNDTDSGVRVAAGIALSKLGDAKTALDMESLLASRAAGKSVEELKKDPGLEAQYAALKNLKIRLLRGRLANELDEDVRQELEQDLATLQQQPTIPMASGSDSDH